MTNQRKKVDFLILILKSYLIILTLGLILPKLIDLLLWFIINRYSNFNNSTFVFNVLSKNELLMSRYIYLLEVFFEL